MQKWVFIITLTILLAVLVLLGVNDTRIAIADTSVPNNEATSSISKTSNSLASATIMITMNTLPSE